MRTLSSTLQAALAGGAISVCTIVRAYLPSGTWGASDANADFTWNGLTYKGFDRAFWVELPATTIITRPGSGSLRLSATDPIVLASFFEEDYRAQRVDISALLFNNASGLYELELPLFKGRLDAATMDEAAQKFEEPENPGISTLTVTVAPLSADLTRVGVRTRSDQDQRLHRDANDGFFKDVGVAAKSQINWGRTGPSSPAGAIGAGNAITLPSGGVSAGGGYGMLANLA